MPTVSTASGREFATFPAAVVVAIVNADEELLLLESPRRRGWWEPVNGGVDAGETLLEAALREVREEAGPDVRVRPLGVVHASSFAYDALVQRIVSVTFVTAYEGGEVVPGSDMAGSNVRWVGLDAIAAERLRLVPPLDEQWLRERTIDLYRLWFEAPDVQLQEKLTAAGWNKVEHAD
jgi:8-oxo-dGTP diphosphatase